MIRNLYKRAWHVVRSHEPNLAPKFVSSSASATSSYPQPDNPQESSSLVRKPGGQLDPNIQPGSPIPQRLIKRIKCEHHGVSPHLFNDDSIWIPIFRFPRLELCRSVVKFKFYLTITSFGASLMRFHQLYLSKMDIDLLPVALLTSTSFVGLVFIGNIFRKFVVQVYLSPDEQYVRLSRFTFFGGRQDYVVPKNQIVPLTETNTGFRKGLLVLEIQCPEKIDPEHDNIEFYDDDYRIFLAIGGILDLEKFESTFGRIMRL